MSLRDDPKVVNIFTKKNITMQDAMLAADVTKLTQTKLVIYGLQVNINGKFIGTALYASKQDGERIANIMHEKFVELKVIHKVEIVDIPVF